MNNSKIIKNEYNFVDMLLYSSDLYHQILDRYFILKKIPAKCTIQHNKSYSDYLKKKIYNLKILYHPDYSMQIARLMTECCPYSYILEPDSSIPKILEKGRQLALDLLAEPAYAEMSQEELSELSKQAHLDFHEYLKKEKELREMKRK